MDIYTCTDELSLVMFVLITIKLEWGCPNGPNQITSPPPPGNQFKLKCFYPIIIRIHHPCGLTGNLCVNFDDCRCKGKVILHQKNIFSIQTQSIVTLIFDLDINRTGVKGKQLRAKKKFKNQYAMTLTLDLLTPKPEVSDETGALLVYSCFITYKSFSHRPTSIIEHAELLGM